MDWQKLQTVNYLKIAQKCKKRLKELQMILVNNNNNNDGDNVFCD